MAKKPKLTAKQRTVAIFRVAKITYKAAPVAIYVQVIGAIISAVLPIATTYFAAATTTSLAHAFAGDQDAGKQAITYVIITSALGILFTAWTSIQQYISRMMRYRVEAAMTDRMYEHFLRLEYWRYDDKKTVDTYDKASQFARFFPYVFDRLTTILSQLISMIAGLVALVFVSWWLGLILIAAVIPGIIIQFRLSRAQTTHWNKNVETRRSKSMIEYSLLQPANMAELRLYGIVRYLLDLRMNLRDKDERIQIQFERSYIPKRLFANALEAAAEVAALVWTVFQIIAKTQPIGQFIYVQQVVSRALNGASGLVGSINSIDEDIANLVDYQEFMELPEGINDTHKIPLLADSIRLDHVSFSYPKSKTKVVDDVSLEIKVNQHVAIVGENGAGKTTLIKLISGLYQPTSGVILVDNQPINKFDTNSWHAQLAVLGQESIGYNFATAKDNIYFGDVTHKFDQKRFDDALNWSESKTFLEKLPKGTDNYVSTWMEDDDGVAGVGLSGGQWQRLALARNFYRNSPIIVLDEPTSAIDALAESRIFNHLFKEKNKTIITISHRLTTVKKADIIFMLKDGQLVEIGTHNELVSLQGYYFKMFESQL